MPNRLTNEASLYLQQHRNNPVDWYPWGTEPFERARKEEKPVLVSIGYSSCHWCHVMAHESFEDAYIARLMNAHFICIKVDREEHPEVDQIYMDAVQMLNGQGGWPLNVFCLPDGRPFAGGTYFPPDDKSGHDLVPWPQLLMRISDFFKRQRADLEQNAAAILGNLRASNMPPAKERAAIEPNTFLEAARVLVENHDPVFGGFGKAPKFPPSMSLGFLLAMRGSATVDLHHKELGEEVDKVIKRTLSGMAHGGIYDQIGGGFARYSVDQQWLIPHFEKMLYDNALLVDIFTKASQRYSEPLYRRIVEETIGWLHREMRAPEGAFFSALDADTPEGEGSTYLWEPKEIQAVLGFTRGKAFCEAYRITPEGNFENTGKSNPALPETDIKIRDSFESARQELLEVRNSRLQPGRDNKRLTAWNALMATSLARASFTFGRPDWLKYAISICDWIWTEMVQDEDQLLSVSYGDGGRGIGTLDDYAFSAEAFLALAAVIDWQHPGTAGSWVDRAIRLAETTLKEFSEPGEAGLYSTGPDHELLVHRKKAWFDNAIPSGNSSMVHVFTQLWALTGEARFGKELDRLRDAYPGIVAVAPGAASHALSGFVHQAVGIAVVKFREGADTEALRQEVVARPWRPVFLMLANESSLVADFQLCVGTRCLSPTDSVSEIAELL